MEKVTNGQDNAELEKAAMNKRAIKQTDAFAAIDDKIGQGYDCLYEHDSVGACKVWLEAWDDLRIAMQRHGIFGIEELDKAHSWGEMLCNWVQDVEMELANAGTKDSGFYRKRIEYCEQLLKIYPIDKADKLLVQNTRRAIAESFAELGEIKQSDALFEQWLSDDPQWGWGWIGWSDCYWLLGDENTDYAKAEAIFSRALAVDGMEDRDALLIRAAEFYKKIGNIDKEQYILAQVYELQKQQEKLHPKISVKSAVSVPLVKTVKVGRNDPCPCGSGKKYKKCCLE